MQFVGVARVQPGLFANFRDSSRVEAADLRENRFGQHAAHFDGAGAALFERRVIEIGEGIRVQNFVRKL